MASYENWLNRRKGKTVPVDLFKLDTKNKTPEQNLVEILQGLYLKQQLHHETSPTNKSMHSDYRSGLRNIPRSSSDSRRLSYLDALITLLSKENKEDLGFTTDELMTCIRISLVDESMPIRSRALRVLRYLIKTESDVAVFNTLKLPYLVMRSLDLMLRNEDERIQALRVIRQVIAVVGSSSQGRRHRAAFIEPGLLRCLASVARAGCSGDGTGDRLARPAIATLSEICVLNPPLFILCGGVTAVVRQLAECATPRMAEALCGVLLHTINDPAARRAARIDLTCLSSPYSDFHVRPAGTESSRDEREMRFACSRLALLCVLRSWPGLLHFCHPRAGGVRALVAALYLPRLEVRKAILDLLYELVGLPQPEWTDEISVALAAVDPSDFQDSWRLNEGFVAAEGLAILPHLSATGPDITEIHFALLLQCFLEAGLLDGLAEVIVTSDTFISVRATVLLGQLLHLSHVYVPCDARVADALPTLAAGAAAGGRAALAALAALRRLHAMLAARPAAASLFLDHIVQYCSGAFQEREDHAKSRKEKDNASQHASMAKSKHEVLNSIEFLNESDDESEPKQRHSIGSRADVAVKNVSALVKSKSVSSRTSVAMNKVKSTKIFNFFERDSDSLIRCTLVMENKDGNTWNWEIIRTILKETCSPPLLNLSDSAHRVWAARVVRYLRPAANKYSHTELSATTHGHAATRAGCQLVRHLLRHNDTDSHRLLEELFNDVSRQIEAIETGVKAHECLFSPQHMCNTMCQMYFLFIGQLCHSQAGLKLLRDTKLYENLLELSTKTHHSCYVKLVISSLDYTLDSYPRDILAKTLTCPIQASRLYATQFLNVLLRASRKSRELVRRKSKLKKNIVQEHLKTKNDSTLIEGVDMETWILEMLVGQVKDESKAVVKCALSILEEAYSIPALVDKLIPMRELLCENCRLDKNAEPSTFDLSAVGDRGYLIWLGLEIAAITQTPDVKSIAFIRKHMDFWTKSYNYRYVRLVEARVHEAVSLCAEWRAPRLRRAARPPPHLHAALARARAHPQPRAMLAAPNTEHYKFIQRKLCSTEQEIVDLKASLWALGNTAVTGQGFQQLMSLTNGYLEDSVPVHIMRLAKYCPVYSVRATAFYVLGLIGSTYEGANLLSELGWLCVRHTRHDQFPLIPDEIHSHDANNQSFITSPDRRFNEYEAEVSENSDRSTAESLHSDYVKHLNKMTEENQDVVDYKHFPADARREPDKRMKSHTLPSQGCSTSHDRPSLSESKTVDILRDFSNFERPIPHSRPENRLLIGRMNSLEHAHEGRVRNTSESSTSGVSSCDSFLGKYAIPDRVTTLSPIPSSSSLYGMKSNSGSQRHKISDLQRRTSTSSFTAADVASSPPSHMDMTGYATLKSLNRHRRPHLSESAATGASDVDDLSWLLTDTSRRVKPFSSLRDRAKTTRERMAKLSLLDYDWKPLCSGEGSPPPAPAPRSVPPPPATRAPAYIGICLPRDLMDLFPMENESKPQQVDKESSKRTRVPSFLADSSNGSDSQKLGLYRGSDVTRSAANFVANCLNAGSSTLIGRSKDGSIGATLNSVTNAAKLNERSDAVKSNASDFKIAIEEETSTDNLPDENGDDQNSKNIVTSENKTSDVKDLKMESAGNASDTNSVRVTSPPMDGKHAKAASTTSEGTSSTAGGVAKLTQASSASVSEAGNTSAGKTERWRHTPADCLACVPTRPPSSHELREAFFSEPSVDSRNVSSPIPDSSPQAEVLHHIHFMANPIHLRQTRGALLTLKQRHPEVFRSPCVYSDACALLARDSYMLWARRFLQEMFFDANFECFAREPAAILARRATHHS